jgi:hypothetical protein
MAAKNRRLGFVVVIIAVFTVLVIVNRRQKLAAETADLILVNGKIVTVDDRFPAASWARTPRATPTTSATGPRSSTSAAPWPFRGSSTATGTSPASASR